MGMKPPPAKKQRLASDVFEQSGLRPASDGLPQSAQQPLPVSTRQGGLLILGFKRPASDSPQVNEQLAAMDVAEDGEQLPPSDVPQEAGTSESIGTEAAAKRSNEVASGAVGDDAMSVGLHPLAIKPGTPVRIGPSGWRPIENEGAGS